MDKSFSSPLFTAKSPFSPRSRQGLTGKRSIGPAAFRKSSRISVSGRSATISQVILKTQQHTVERFGLPLPVLVTEALTFADRNAAVSAKISPECGYAWLVCGRRLLIWQYRVAPAQIQAGTPRRGGITNQCYELQLPQSDLAHKAELVAVFPSNGNTFPSCIAVSPEGVVRYWPAIAHEGMSVEQQIDLQGQECDSLTSVEGLGCILATTTCTVVLVQRIEAPRPSLTCHTLKMPSGWLGGFSKRMSSFIFGPNSADTSVETRMVRVLSVPLEDNQTWYIYVLAGHTLQKWKLSTHETEEFLYAADLTRPVKEGFFNTFWETCGGEINDVESWILDIQPDSTGLLLLGAAVNTHISPEIHYAMITVDASQTPANFSSFSVLKFSGIYNDTNTADNLGLRFITSANTSYLHNRRGITVVKLHEDADYLEFNTAQDYLLGGSICVNTPVFFSRIHGLVSVTPNDSADFNNTSMISAGTPLETTAVDSVGSMHNMTLSSFNPEEMQTAYKDKLSQLKAAFIYNIHNKIPERNSIISEVFADILDENYRPYVDSSIDSVIATISNDILDDTPANDPHWLNKPVGLGSSYAMQVSLQLEDKQTSHALFVKFLREADIWKRLGAVTVRNAPLLTAYILAENSEKIVAALTLRTKTHDEIIQKAIDAATKELHISREGGLSNQSIFYSQLNTFQNVIIELVANCDAAAHSDMNPNEVALVIKETNTVILDVLKQILSYRQTHLEVYEPTNTWIAPEYVPWTAASGREGLMDSLMSQQYLTFNYGAKGASDFSLQTNLFEQQVALVDIILDARKSHLQSIQGVPNADIMRKQYDVDRKKLIQPLIEEGQWEGAASLAEKYLDFESLIIICEKTNNQERLDTYMERFKEQDFPNFVYNWFLQENKQGKLIDLCNRHDAPNHTTQDLRNFLTTHPTLSWIQNTFDRKFGEASATLRKLAAHETDSLTRQKTMLSLAKLAALTAEHGNAAELKHLNMQLDLIGYQEELPDYVLQQYGYDSLKPCVIPAKDLIHLYTCEEYADATELDYKKGLDLLNYITDAEQQKELALNIWKSAILRDHWDETNLDSPIQILQNKMMFKIVDLALFLGAEPKTLLPPLHSLLNHPDLVELQNSKSFEFLLRTGYEHVFNIMGI